jgi:hypothetical protein
MSYRLSGLRFVLLAVFSIFLFREFEEIEQLSRIKS